MRILITGAAGFLGSNLVDRFLKKGFSVISLDNLFTGNIQNIEKYFNHPNFEFIQQDICHPIFLDVDVIYNLASPASVRHYQKDPIYTMKTNILGTLHMLELAKKNNAKMLQASTSEVYGDPVIHPQKEEYFGNVNPIGIRSCYDEGKRAAETLCFDFQRKYNVNVKVARIFNTYGPNMDVEDGRVISNFIVQALKGEDITIYGKGEQTRSFCFVDDLLDGFIKIMEADYLGPVNLGNPEEYKIIDLARLIMTMTESSSKFSYLDLPSDDPQMRRPDITKARKLGWEPHINIQEGLKKTIEYFSKKIFSENRLILQ